MKMHTPGPWRVARQNPSPTTGEWMISSVKRSGYLAEVRDCGSGDIAANARLIAAAPEMLRVLIDCEKNMIISTNQDMSRIDIIRDVIAIATGNN